MTTAINGRFFDYSDVEISMVRGGAAREVLVEVFSISYPHAIERSLVYGTGRYPLGHTTGRYAPGDASFEIYRQRYMEIVGLLGDRYGDTEFVFGVKYRDGDGPLFEDTIEALLAGEDHSAAQGSDPLGVTVNLHPRIIRINGKELL